MRKIAVTGGIASGKSTAAKVFKEHGAYVVCADDIVHRLLSPETVLGKKIIALLGEGIVNHGVIDRRQVARKVFSNKDLLLQLENIIHPEVRKIIDDEYKVASKKKSPFFVADIPLLFEGHFEDDYDTIILIDADVEISKKRFNQTHDTFDFESRNTRLIPISEKVSKSDFVIKNNGTLKEFEEAIKKIIPQLI